MGFRKFQADFLFTGRQVLPSTAVLIMNETGRVMALTEEKEAGDDIERFTGILCPGFINTHCHLELSHMKGRIPPGTGLVTFLSRIIKERFADGGGIHKAMHAAAEEMSVSGTVAVADICNTPTSSAIKKASPIHWRNFIEVMGFTEDGASFRYEEALKVLSRFETDGQASITPHAPYSVSRKLFGLINNSIHGGIVSIHNQESLPENLLYQENRGEMFELYRSLGIDPSSFVSSGKSSLQTYLPWLDKASHILLVHNTYSSEADILFALSRSQGSQKVFFCICINANRYIASSVPPIDLLRKRHAPIILGTDSYASNWQLDMLEEVKSIQQSFHIPLPEILQWATLNGAMALKMDNTLGSFDAGKQPGVVLIDKLENGVVAADARAKLLLR